MKHYLLSVILAGFTFGVCLFLTFSSFAANYNLEDPYSFNYSIPDLLESQDTIPPRYDDFITGSNNNPFDLNDPPAIQQEVEYDPVSNTYIITERIGEGFYTAPTYMTFEEYMEWTAQQQQNRFFNQLAGIERESGEFDVPDPLLKMDPESHKPERWSDQTIEIRPQGHIDLTFGADYQRVDNPILTERQRRQGGFNFDMDIRMNVTGQIGDKMKLGTNYNTQAMFDFENQMNIGYEGEEDDIIKKIEAGNVSMPLRSQLIQGSQSLFGLKTELQFGRLTLTSVLSQQKSQRKNLQIQGGTQLQTFSITADRYDENRHFFLSHYNRAEFEPAQANLPQLQTLFRITRLEVWVTNTRNQTEGVRDIVAFTDLAEGDASKLANQSNITINPGSPRDLKNNSLPTNSANNLYQNLLNIPQVRSLDNAVSSLRQLPFNLEQVRDFQQVRARKLLPTEFTFHPELGYVSVNINLRPDDILGVAYEYTYNGQVYQVGEFGLDAPSNPDTLGTLYVKMLKSSTPRIDMPMWDLMMKNIYSLGAFQVSPEDFKLDVFYQDPGGGEIRHLPEGNLAGIPLLRIFNLDNLNRQGDPFPDGVFDFVPGTTLNPTNGRIIFPVLEPFGSSLASQFDDPQLAMKYSYQILYDSTITRAREYPEFNRFVIRGSYRSSVSTEISLGAFNVPRGSVRVSAGGQQLIEGQDYEVDYNLGRVRILNESLLNSGLPINVSFEDNTMFGFQTQTLIGTRADYWINDNFTLGATFMRLHERPFTQKVNVGDDPISNNIFGFDMQYTTETPWITRAIDFLPFIQTRAESNITFTGEVAYLKPGSSRAIKQDDESVVYIDDFEGAASRFDLRSPANAWVISSIPHDDPQGNNPLFPESDLMDSLVIGMNRAKLTWYRIDPSIRINRQQSVYTRPIRQDEIFPNRQLQPGQAADVFTFDMTFYPDQRGPYNYETYPTQYTAGIEPDGRLADPKSRWGGIMRSISNNDFEAANIEFIEFWMLSPYLESNNTPQGQGGSLYINLGNVSEDILKDGRYFFENGLPRPGTETRVDTTAWGVVPRTQSIVNAFDNDPEVRKLQDVGLDGLNNEAERVFFAEFLENLAQIVGVNSPAYQQAFEDPSNDDYIYYNDPIYQEEDDIIAMYYRYNGQQGNSQSPEGNVLSAGTNLPDSEDINRDNTLNQDESYFQYEIPLIRDGDGLASNPFITDTVQASGGVWYQFKIPIENFTSRVGGIQDFRSIRFIRMYMHGFEDQVTLRFARLEMVRNQWRKYRRSLMGPGVVVVEDEFDNTTFDVTAVNIEENSGRSPFPYVLPPGIVRERSVGPYPDILQNEQALSLAICNLKDGDARGVYKIINLDMRMFKRLRMFVHAESQQDLNPGDLKIFMRLGSDFELNYYEYELPLVMSDPTISQNTPDYDRVIWPEENEFDFMLEMLKDAKIARNVSEFSLSGIYEVEDPNRPGNFIRVKGNPDLGLVKGVLVGVRNAAGDGVPRCTEVWINELRLSGFDERGGVAGLARLDVKLADLGNLTASGSYSSIGWGSLDQKLAERAREEVIQYDISTNLQLGRFLPTDLGIQVPFYAQYSNTISNPQYDPYTYDIPLKELLEAYNDAEIRDSLRTMAQTVTTIRGYNFTNIRKTRGTREGGPRPWDISNFSLTYSFTQTFRRDPTIERSLEDLHRGALDYGYSRQGKFIQPLQKMTFGGNYLKWLKDFNFNPLPNSFAMSNQITRFFGETTYRFSSPEYSTWFDKRFQWERNYNLQWNLARSLNFNFAANNLSIIDEPEGRIDTQEKRDSVWNNVKDFGRNKLYRHNYTLAYTVPTRSIPIIDWINIRAQLTGDYSWNAATLNTDSLGNIIQNSQTRQLNADFNLVNFYNKSKYFRQINGGGAPPRGAPPRGQQPGQQRDRQTPQGNQQQTRQPSTFEKVALRPLLSLRRARLTYTQSYRSVIPGFMPTTSLLGFDENFDAPRFAFISGFQPEDNYLDNIAQKEWITRSVWLNQQVLRDFSEDITASINIEPFRDFRLDLDARRTFVRNKSEYFKVDEPGGDFAHLAQREMGSLSLSYFTLNTLFNGNTPSGLSENFLQFEENRKIISQRLAGSGANDHDTDPAGFKEGFGRYQQQVLVPAFLAAYTGKDANTVDLQPYNKLPIPNWRLSWTGLGRLPLLKEVFQSINITHGYRSTLTINEFYTNFNYSPDSVFNKNPLNQNYYHEVEVPAINIVEQFMPLIGVDVRLKNEMTASVDWKMSRNLAMSFIDYQLSETKTNEFTIGWGYRFRGLKLPFNLSFGRNNNGKLENDLNFRFDFSMRDDITINHLLDQNVAEPTRGMKTIRISPSIDYAVSEQLTVRLFFDRSQSIPATSASFPITNTKGGVTIRFSLAQ